MMIPARPVALALALDRLGAALLNKTSFCLHGDHVPASMDAPFPRFVTLTGGSTGQPKAILRTQASWTASFEINARLFDLDAADTLAVLGDLSHSLALYGVLEALYLGMDAHVLAEFEPTAQHAAIAQNGVTVIYATPTQLRRLTHLRDVQPLAGVKRVLCGGGALDGDTAAALALLFPDAGVNVFYGAAETSFITIADAETPPGAVGRPYPGVELRILDDDGQDTDGTGMVWVRSPYLFDGYACSRDTSDVLREGCVTAGEMGHLDPDGTLWLEGRGDRMINIGDQSVFPEQVESFVRAQPGVRDAAVLPVADALRGHRLVLLIEGGDNDALAARLKAACRATLGPLLTPKTVVFCCEFPRLRSGKLDLAALSTWVEGNI